MTHLGSVQFRQGTLVNSQRMFLHELSSLQSDKYIEVYAHYGRTLWMCKLKHLNNGRTLIMKAYPDYYVLREKEKILKEVCFTNK